MESRTLQGRNNIARAILAIVFTGTVSGCDPAADEAIHKQEGSDQYVVDSARAVYENDNGLRTRLTPFEVPPIPLTVDTPADLAVPDPLARLQKARLKGFEYDILRRACLDNGCSDIEMMCLVAAIRKTENGRPGFEYGVEVAKAKGYEKQARWCAATVSKFFRNKGYTIVSEESVKALAAKYCPVNRHVWAKNVLYWLKKMEADNGLESGNRHDEVAKI